MKSVKANADDVSRLVDSEKAELVSLLVNLIKAKSENPPGDTSAPASVAEEYLSTQGVSVRKYAAEEGCVNLVATLGQGVEDLTYCGHIDTVPAGDPAKWTVPPLAGKMSGGKVFGRGSTDMKAGCAALTFAFAKMIKHEKGLSGRLVLALVADEESGGKKGVQYLIEKGILKSKNLVLGEPTKHEGTGHVVVAGEKGTYWVRITCDGVPRHGSLPMLGDSAILNAMPVLEGFKTPILDKVTIPHSAASLVREAKRVLRAEYPKDAAKKPYYAADHYTVNIGRIEGGTKVNVVPDSCSVELDIRVPIGGSKEEAEKLVRRRLPKGAKLELINYAQPAFTLPSSPLVRSIQRAARSVFAEPSPAMCITATTDAHHFRASLGSNAVAYGPGLESMCHVLDEYVETSEVISASKVYLDLAMRMLME
jgi:succinyl-diaminopimelate desuccinylase